MNRFAIVVLAFMAWPVLAQQEAGGTGDIEFNANCLGINGEDIACVTDDDTNSTLELNANDNQTSSVFDIKDSGQVIVFSFNTELSQPALIFKDGGCIKNETGGRVSIDIGCAGSIEWQFNSDGLLSGGGTENLFMGPSPPSYGFQVDLNTFYGRDTTDTLKLVAGGEKLVTAGFNGTGSTLKIIEASTQGATDDSLIIEESDGTDIFTVDRTSIDASAPIVRGKQTTTLGVAATSLVVTNAFIVLTGDGGANTLATLTGAPGVMVLRILFVDALVTITDTDAHTADTVDLNAAFTSADDTTLTLLYDGISWYETSRSVN